MKTRIVASLAIALAALTLWQTMWRRVYAQATPVTIPFVSGIVDSGATAEGGINIFIRQSDSTYTNLQFGLSSPHAFMSSMSSLTQLLSSGLQTLFAAPAGPAGVGLQSQTRAVADLDHTWQESLPPPDGQRVSRAFFTARRMEPVSWRERFWWRQPPTRGGLRCSCGPLLS